MPKVPLEMLSEAVDAVTRAVERESRLQMPQNHGLALRPRHVGPIPMLKNPRMSDGLAPDHHTVAAGELEDAWDIPGTLDVPARQHRHGDVRLDLRNRRVVHVTPVVLFARPPMHGDERGAPLDHRLRDRQIPLPPSIRIVQTEPNLAGDRTCDRRRKRCEDAADLERVRHQRDPGSIPRDLVLGTAQVDIYHVDRERGHRLRRLRNPGGIVIVKLADDRVFPGIKPQHLPGPAIAERLVPVDDRFDGHKPRVDQRGAKRPAERAKGPVVVARHRRQDQRALNG